MSKKTIRVDEADFDVAKERKESNGQTWGEYLTDENRTGPDTDSVVSELTARLNVDTDGAMQDIDELQAAIEGMQDELKHLESNISVTLEATERKAIAETVVEEMR